MKPENKQFLDENTRYIESYQQYSPPMRIGFNDRAKMLEVIQQEFDSTYQADLWCPVCVGEMVLHAYKLYDEYKQQTISG